MNNINEKISEMIENEQMPYINARDLKSKADEYNQNNESYRKELYNVITAINKKITTEAEQGKYLYKDHIDGIDNLGKTFEQFIYDIMEYYKSRSFTVEFNKQLDCSSYKYTISWNNILDDNSDKKYYDLDKTCEELQKVFNDNKNITIRKDEVNIERYGFMKGIVIEFYGNIWMTVTSWNSIYGDPYTFVNSYGYLANHVSSFKELVDIISNGFETITKEQCLDVDQYEYNNIDKTFDYLENFFKDKNVFFSRSTDENKFEYITASIPYSYRLRIDCCDETKHYTVDDTRNDYRIGDFNTLIKLINIIEAYIRD